MEQLYKDMGQVSSIGWYGKNNKNAWGGVYEMPKQFLFPIEKHMYTVFTDIITFPTFMGKFYGERCHKIIQPFFALCENYNDGCEEFAPLWKKLGFT